MNENNSLACLKSKNVSPERANRILDKLNSLNSAEAIARIVAVHSGEGVLSIRVAQRIINRKTELGGFQDLWEVATVPRIGAKTFNVILNALDD